MNSLAPTKTTNALPTIGTAAGATAQLSFLEVFAASIRNVHTRRA